jgi:twitching motility protein PilT
MDKVVLEDLLSSMLRMGASSLHLIPGQRPAIRVQRRFVMSEQEPIGSVEIEELTRDFLFEDHRRRLHDGGQVDVLYVSGSGARFRTTVMRQSDGISVLMRPVPAQPPRLNDLELPPHVGSFTQYRSGLIVVSGFFGAGKSTTLAALIDKINHESVRHIVTLEDPIEFLHPIGSALLHQREIGVHVGSFAEGIRQAVRLGANVILAGELRDGDTLEAALDAVESGCLVLTSVSASSVVAACTEIPSLVALEHRARIRTRLASALRVVISQTLLQRSHQKGRVPLVEILINNMAVRAAIRAASFQELPAVMQRCRGLGMQTADLALRGLVARHLVAQEEARYHVLERDQGAMRAAAPAAAPPKA